MKHSRKQAAYTMADLRSLHRKGVEATRTLRQQYFSDPGHLQGLLEGVQRYLGPHTQDPVLAHDKEIQSELDYLAILFANMARGYRAHLEASIREQLGEESEQTGQVLGMEGANGC